MSITNLGFKHLTEAQQAEFDNATAVLIAILKDVTQPLDEKQRISFGSINEKNKLFVNKVNDYKVTRPDLSSPDVNWDEFVKDFKDRSFSDTRLNTQMDIVRMLTDFKIVHDYDNYQAALKDYSYTQYKAGGNEPTPGFKEKEKELKQFFPRSGGGGDAEGGTVES